MSLVLDTLSDQTQLDALAPEWTALVEANPAATPFQHPDWLLPWWTHFGSGRLQVFTWRDAGRLTGILPCFLHHWSGKRQLTLLGSGISDWTDPIVTSIMVDELDTHLMGCHDWDVLHWQDLSADTPLRQIQEVTAHPDTPCSAISLSGSFEDYWAARSSDLRRNVRRYSERAAKTGTVRFEVIAEADTDILDHLFRLHGARWQRQGQEGMVALNRSEAFLNEVASRFSASHRLRLLLLRFDEKTVAGVMTFPFRHTLFCYLSAFDPEWEKLGFGRTLLFNSIRWAFENGYTAWNFLRGDEPYKQSWGAELVSKICLYKER